MFWFLLPLVSSHLGRWRSRNARELENLGRMFSLHGSLSMATQRSAKLTEYSAIAVALSISK
jgi:hypothetical protein